MTLTQYFKTEKNKAIDDNKLHLFNTISKKKELFTPIHKDHVGFYSCGPTVYNFAHIGNLRSYIFADILKRTLEFNKYNVKHVMNITDVGHLASDADIGEDKMLLGAKREKKSVTEIADFYTNAFKKDLQKLNIKEPSIWCKATDHIIEMLDLIKKIEKNGFTYNANGNIYFDVLKFNKKYDYTKLTNLKLNSDDFKSRIESDSNKKSPFDFVLWFTKSKFSDQEQKWNSPYGIGYPGWHIECSAMSVKYLGEEFDIHSGGIDHIPVHHTNEIAQCLAGNGKMFAKYWLHGEFLVLSKEKMAKSGSNFITLSSIIEKGYEPLSYRYFCLNSHYRQQLQFSYEALEGAKSSFNKLKNKIIEIKKNAEFNNESDFKDIKLDEKDKKVIKEYIDYFTESINDDMNMPKTIALMWDLIKDLRLDNKIKLYLLFEFDSVYGFDFKSMTEDIIEIPQNVLALAEERKLARQNKDFKKSDILRDEILSLGYVVSDSKDNSFRLFRTK